MIRVVAGSLKGKRLTVPRESRPYLGRAKEALFSILPKYLDLKESIIWDCFCGSGSLGIEALSRGAKLVYFCEKSYSASEILKGNCQGQSEARIFKGDVLSHFPDEIVDCVFFDPPYSIVDLSKFAIHAKKFLHINSVLVLHTPVSREALLPSFSLLDKRVYGGCAITFWSPDLR